jgi:predicted DNA-binding transcriptional regulator YafY
LLLDDEEAVAVAVGLRTAASGTVSGIEEASVRALAKVEQVLPSRLRKRVSGLHSFIVQLASGGPTIAAETLTFLASACRDCEMLRFDYKSRDGSPSVREVEPHRLVHNGRRWYLAAWDVGRNNWRTFRVDRIQAKITRGARFVARPAPEGDFAAYVARSVSYAPMSYRAKVRFYGSKEKLAERIPPGAGTLESEDETSCVLQTGDSSLEMLSIYLGLSGLDFEVLEPPELIELVRAMAARFGRAVPALTG